jgi:hypothetical protein
LVAAWLRASAARTSYPSLHEIALGCAFAANMREQDHTERCDVGIRGHAVDPCADAALTRLTYNVPRLTMCAASRHEWPARTFARGFLFALPVPWARLGLSEVRHGFCFCAFFTCPSRCFLFARCT